MGSMVESTVADQRPDTELLESIIAGDVEAFRVLFERYQPVLFRLALSSTRDVALAHDIAQEAFVRLWERRSSLRPQLSILAYLLRIGENLARDAARQRARHGRLEQGVPPPALSEGDDPMEALQVRIIEQELERAIHDTLPERCRQVFLLSRIEQRSNREIAALLGISVRTVEHQINHALKVLQRHLKRYL